MGLLDFLFGKPKTHAQMLRDNQRLLKKALRNIEREKMSLEQQEKKLLLEIRQMAKMGQTDALKVTAKDIVRTRKHIKSFAAMKATIQAASAQITTLSSQQALGDAMLGVTRCLRGMNIRFQLPRMKFILQEFEKQTDIMNAKQEIMNDAIDGTQVSDEEDEGEGLVTQIMDELGLELTSNLQKLPTIHAPEKPVDATQPISLSEKDDLDLEERFNNLKRKDDI